MRHWITKHPLVTYFLLAYGITWVLLSPLVLQQWRVIGIIVPPVWSGIGALGPITAAFLTATLSGGKAAIADLISGMTRWRVGLLGWGLALSPVLLFLVALGVLPLLGQPFPDPARLSSSAVGAPWLFAGLLASVVYGIGEEPGWRGFALPRLQRRWNALLATTVLTGLWACWHAPFFVYRFQFGPGEVIGFVTSLYAGALWLTFVYQVTGGSTLVTMIWHMLWNAVIAVGMVLSPLLAAILSTLMIIIGVLVIFIGKPGSLAGSVPRVVYPKETATLPVPTARRTSSGQPSSIAR
ncbi:MAG: CPBP family intramembrane metalloprotease [Ktedonobacterales bacterium]|nr:CPBP family intramembrane metalloprotease [Ktedonobacterales bacterium]